MDFHIICPDTGDLSWKRNPKKLCFSTSPDLALHDEGLTRRGRVNRRSEEHRKLRKNATEDIANSRNDTKDPVYDLYGTMG